MLAEKRILLIGAWDDLNVSFENIFLPLYRELKNEKAEDVTVAGVKGGHSLKNSRDELVETIIEWIKEKSTR